MIDLNLSSWKKYKIGDIFECKTTKAVSSEDITEGNTVYITRSSAMNGFSGNISFDAKKINKGNCITIGAEGVVAFYQEDDFLAGVKVYTLRHKKMNKYNALFICTILNTEKYRYSYGRARVLEKLKNEEILLPYDSEDSDSPNFDLMESYIKSLWGGSHNTTTLYRKCDLKTEEWQEFEIKDLFLLEKCKCACASDLEEGQDIYYIGAKKSNNGIIKKVKKKKDLISKGNGIIFICDGQGSVGYSNYIDEDFIGSTTLMIGYNKHLNKYNGLFIVTILDKEKNKYSYGRKYAPKLKTTKIKLPSKNNEPDWDFMEKYIRQLQFSDLIDTL